MSEQLTRVQRFKRTPLGARVAEHPLVSWAWLRARSVPFYARTGHVARARILADYLAGTEEPKLQFGSGATRLPGWLNSDLVTGDIYLDIARPLPLPDASFAYAFGEHIIEHIPEGAGVQLLEELFRVVRPGGAVRITTPDLRKIIALYEDRNPVIALADYARFMDEITDKRNERGAQVLNNFFHQWGHQWIYDEEDLSAKLAAAGFTEIVRREPGESAFAALTGLEHHGPPWENDAEAMCLEARRP